MTHRVKLLYNADNQTYKLKCIWCGQTIDIFRPDQEYDIPGTCVPPDDLYVHVVEEIGIKDEVMK